MIPQPNTFGAKSFNDFHSRLHNRKPKAKAGAKAQNRSSVGRNLDQAMEASYNASKAHSDATTQPFADYDKEARAIVRAAQAEESLDRARGGSSLRNHDAIISGFMALGISAVDIIPRENVLTFWAWKALGRSVKKGEHGVKIAVWIHTIDKETGEASDKLYCTRSTVFHVSQTQEVLL